MKIFKKVASVLLATIMLFSLVSCGNSNASSSNVVMRYGDQTLTEGEFKYIASYIKDSIVYSQQNYYYQYTGKVYDEAEILEMKIDSDRTVADYIEDYVVEFAQQLLIIEKLCDEAKIEITEEKDKTAIQDYILNIQDAFGGEDLFEIKLAELGFSKSGIERYQRLDVLFELLYEDRYGENGSARIPEASVHKHFIDNYLRYDGVMYSYYNPTNSSQIVYEYTDEAILEYYTKNYVKVRHILYLTQNLDEEKKAAKKEAANAAYQSIVSGEKSFDDYKKDNEDSGSEYTFTYGEMVSAFEKASFEMNVGDVRIVETEYGYHIIEKLDKTTEDLFGTVGADGKTTGGIRSKVVAAMSADTIRNEALTVLEKLNSGELKSYPEENKETVYYIKMGEAFIPKDDTTSQYFIELVASKEKDVYFEEEVNGKATYILRNLSFTEKDITSDIYSEIEESLSLKAFSEYVMTFYDDVEIDTDVLASIQITNLPALYDEFYANYN